MYKAWYTYSMEKTCTLCKETKLLELFAGKDNYSPWCKSCHATRAREWYHKNKEKASEGNRRWIADNKERRNEYRREHYASNPDYRQKSLDWHKKFRDENKELVKQKKAAYYIKNREREQAKARARYQTNPDYFKENARKRKNRLKSTLQEPYTKQQIYDRDKGLCSMCHELVDILLKHPNPMCFSFDHTKPLIKGGYDTPDNVTTTHLVCNLKKGSAHL